MINHELYCLQALSQDGFLMLNKKLIAILGLEKSVFIAYLIDKYKQLKNENNLNNGYFYSTDNDILLFTGLKLKTIQKIKIEGEDLGLFFVKKEGIPAKTFYKINFSKINSYFLIEKSQKELSYERILDDDISLENVTYNLLKEISIRKLQLFCKQNKITYSGNYNKQKLIEKILYESQKLKNIKNESFIHSKEKILEMNVKDLRKACKNLDISYSGNSNKEELQNKLLDFFNKKEVDETVNKKSVNKCTINLSTSVQKSCNKKEQNIITKNKEQNHNHDVNDMEELKKLFVEWNINFTQKNQNSINKLLKTMSYQEVRSYLTEVLENLKSNPEVIDIPALFSTKIAKGERQSKFIPQKTEKKELGEDKKEWLRYFSGICSDKNLKTEIENIIADIPFEVLRKNKSKLSRLEIFDFKSVLYQLKNQNLQL